MRVAGVDRHLAAQSRIAGAVDLPHAAGAERSEDLIRAWTLSGQRRMTGATDHCCRRDDRTAAEFGRGGRVFCKQRFHFSAQGVVARAGRVSVPATSSNEVAQWWLPCAGAYGGRYDVPRPTRGRIDLRNFRKDRPMRNYLSSRIPRCCAVMAVLAAGAGGLHVLLGLPVDAAPGPTLSGGNLRVSTHDFFPADPFFSEVGPPPDVLQQNEPSIAVHPAHAQLIAVGMNDVRTLAVSDDAWQGLAVSTNGGESFDFEALVPGFPGDTSPDGLASPVRGNAAASDPWLSFDNFGDLFFAFIAFQRTPPGRPDFDPQATNAIAVAKYSTAATGVQYLKTVVVERGTVGLGRQEDKEALAVDNGATSPFNGNIYLCWARFTGSQDHLKVARSIDHGESYAMADLGPARNMQGCNVAAAPTGDVFVSWRTFDNNSTNSNPRDSAIFVARSTDGGATFGPGVRVATFVDYRQVQSRAIPSFRTFSDTFLAADENGVYAAWQQKNGTSGADVMVSRSRTNGATWETPVRPHAPFGHQIFPFLAAAGGTLSIAWYDGRSEPAFNPDGPVTGQCPAGATTGAGCTGMDVFYAQARTAARGPLGFGPSLRVTSQSFNPNLFGSIKAISPFIGDYIAMAATAATAFIVWTDNRDINPTLNAEEDADVATDPPALVNGRSRDSNVYFQRIAR